MLVPERVARVVFYSLVSRPYCDTQKFTGRYKGDPMMGSVGNVAADDSALLQDLVARYKWLQSEVTALKAEVETKQDSMDCLYQVESDLYVVACNLHVQDGTGISTSDTAAPNGLGNLIVGYNEDHWGGSEKTGSHNVIVGAHHTYTNQSGLVTGVGNTITGKGAAVIGGQDNVASGTNSSVSGGYDNEASETWSSVSGGVYNVASGSLSSVNGGANNTASGGTTTICAMWPGSPRVR